MRVIKTQIAVGLIVLACISARPAVAQPVPQLMNYQGQLQDSKGAPLPTGDYVISFRIWDAAVGGRSVWGPQVFDGQTGAAGHGAKIPVVQGFFNTLLGPVDSSNRGLAEAFVEPTRWIEITVGENPAVSPRQQMVSSPFALQSGEAANSQKLAGYDWGVLFAGGNPASGTFLDNKIRDGSIDIAKLAASLAELLVPSGAIMAFGGEPNRVPAGWILCNNQALSSKAHPKLFAAIGTAWGDASDDREPATDFRVPESRGLFLRGLAMDAIVQDPARNERERFATGSNLGNRVGSFQRDAFRSHDHGGRTSVGDLSGTDAFRDYNTTSGNANPPAFVYRYDQRNVGGHMTEHTHRITAEGGPETRPVNVYVTYIIKD